jgi:hypothetical protein
MSLRRRVIRCVLGDMSIMGRVTRVVRKDIPLSE